MCRVYFYIAFCITFCFCEAAFCFFIFFFAGSISILRIASEARGKAFPRVVHFNSGDWTDGTYTGELDGHGKPHGRGKKEYSVGGGPFKYLVGDTYDGEWRHGLYHGRGVLAKADGTVRASGYWRNGKFSETESLTRLQVA